MTSLLMMTELPELLCGCTLLHDRINPVNSARCGKLRHSHVTLCSYLGGSVKIVYVSLANLMRFPMIVSLEYSV
jgi:hypothetical protein